MKGKFRVKPLLIPHGNARYRVDGNINGKRMRFFCQTLEEAKEKAEIQNNEVRQHGHEHASMPARLRMEALQADELLAPLGVSLVEAARYYLKAHETRSKSATVAEAYKHFAAYFLKRFEMNAIGDRNYKNAICYARRFAAEFGKRQICDIEALEIQQWLFAKDVKLTSKNAERRNLSMFFGFCVKQGWLKKNTISDVESFSEKRLMATKEAGVLTAKEAAKLLETASEDLLPSIAIGLFAGLRTAEICRLTWGDLNWKTRRIDMHAKITKTSKPRWVTMSDNLVEWLEPLRGSHQPSDPIWGLSENWRIVHTTNTAQAAGIRDWPHNALRHSFGSYHLAAYDNAGLTAKEMGHRSTDIIYAHYYNRRTKEEALEYWNIRPHQADEKIVAFA